MSIIPSSSQHTIMSSNGVNLVKAEGYEEQRKKVEKKEVILPIRTELGQKNWPWALSRPGHFTFVNIHERLKGAAV